MRSSVGRATNSFFFLFFLLWLIGMMACLQTRSFRSHWRLWRKYRCVESRIWLSVTSQQGVVPPSLFSVFVYLIIYYMDISCLDCWYCFLICLLSLAFLSPRFCSVLFGRHILQRFSRSLTIPFLGSISVVDVMDRFDFGIRVLYNFFMRCRLLISEVFFVFFFLMCLCFHVFVFPILCTMPLVEWTGVTALRVDGNFLFSGGEDYVIRAWDCISKTELKSIRSHNAEIVQVEILFSVIFLSFNSSLSTPTFYK